MASETVTRKDLMAILNKALPSDHYIEGWEYVGDVYWWQDSWTCPEDGFIEVNVNPSANGWYYRISDSTHPDTGWSHRMGGYYTYSQSQIYFVKKGAVLKNHSMDNVASINVWYYKFVLKDPTTVSPVDSVIARTVSANINMAYGYNVTVTAPTISGYKFLCWAHVTTTGWLGCVNPEFPLQQTSPMWNATQGNSGTGQIDCLALYIPMRNSDADGVVSLTTVKETYTKTLSTSTWYGTTTFDITKDGYTPISAVASVNQVRYHCQVSDFTDTSATVQVADYSSTGMDVTVKLVVTYAMN